MGLFAVNVANADVALVQSQENCHHGGYVMIQFRLVQKMLWTVWAVFVVFRGYFTIVAKMNKIRIMFVTRTRVHVAPNLIVVRDGLAWRWWQCVYPACVYIGLLKGPSRLALPATTNAGRKDANVNQIRKVKTNPLSHIRIQVVSHKDDFYWLNPTVQVHKIKKKFVICDKSAMINRSRCLDTLRMLWESVLRCECVFVCQLHP